MEIVAEITAKYKESALLARQYAVDEEIKKTKYHEMIEDDIRPFVSMSSCRTLLGVIARAEE